MGFPANCSFEDPLMRQWLTDEAWDDAWEVASLDGCDGDGDDSGGGNDDSGSGDGNGDDGRGGNSGSGGANGRGGNGPPDRRDPGGYGGSCSTSHSGYSTFSAGCVKTYRACAKSSSQTSRSLFLHEYDLRKPGDSGALLSGNPSGLSEQDQLVQYCALLEAFLGWFSLLYELLCTDEVMYHDTSPFDDRDLVRQVAKVY